MQGTPIRPMAMPESAANLQQQQQQQLTSKQLLLQVLPHYRVACLPACLRT